MYGTTEERAARKKLQLARIAAKGTPEYHEMYAKNPVIIARAAAIAAERELIRQAKIAKASRVVSEAEEAAEAFTSGPRLTAKEDKS